MVLKSPGGSVQRGLGKAVASLAMVVPLASGDGRDAFDAKTLVVGISAAR